MQFQAKTAKPATDVRAAVAAWRVRPYEYGLTDCCCFVDFVLAETTGQRYLPTYENEDGARAILRRYGGLSGAVSRYMARAPVEAGALRDGDVALIWLRGTEALGIILGSKVLTVTESGIVRDIPRRFVIRGWKVWA